MSPVFSSAELGPQLTWTAMRENGKFRKGVSKELRDELEVVFGADKAALVRETMLRFQVTFGTGHSYEELVSRIKTKLIDGDIAEDILLHGLGWAKKEIDNAVEQDSPPMISVDQFRSELIAFSDRLRGRNYLPSFAGPPSLQDIELHKIRLFVHQLNLVDVAEQRVLSAIADFLSARTNRVQYAERGYVHRDSLGEFESALKNLWQNLRDEVELGRSEDEVTRGQRLLLRCLREKPKLQGIDVPDDFVRGCFHTLADKPLIGWHPRYEELLKRTGL